MFTSVFNVFKIGIGPSSSHTVGPMRAALEFLQEAREASPEKYASVHRVRVDLFGSLALTGIGHGTDLAVLLGLEGETPQHVDTTDTLNRVERIRQEKSLNLWHHAAIPFNEKKDLIFNRMQRLPYHSNAMTLTLFDEEGAECFQDTYYSIGGGEILNHKHINKVPSPSEPIRIPYEFSTGAELLELCHTHNKSIAQLSRENECSIMSEGVLNKGLRKIWKTMSDCIEQGCETEGILPGGLNVHRRAPALYRSLVKNASHDPSEIMDWVSLYALATNEENAAGGRIVTAPTNGAAGIMPAVFKYYERYYRKPTDKDLRDYFLTGAAICTLFQEKAAISGAEMGCQGEVGVACSMAAAGLAALMGGNPKQVERAAEIGMEHNLGLTCDPVKGLVQVPCIERNTMGAIKAINAAKLAMRQDCDTAIVSLDKVIKTMAQVGHDMKSRYKETAKGGLAINVVEC